MQCYECEPRTAETVVDLMKKLEHLPCCANGVPESPSANEMGLIIAALGGTAKMPLSCAENKVILRELLRGVKCLPPMWGGTSNAPAAVHALAGAELALDGPLHVFKSVATDMWDAMFEKLSTADRAVLSERISALLNGHEVGIVTAGICACACILCFTILYYYCFARRNPVTINGTSSTR